jgi:hypothetical protein
MKSQFAFKVLVKSNDTQYLPNVPNETDYLSHVCRINYQWGSHSNLEVTNRTLRLNLYAYKFYYSKSLFNDGVTFLKITVYSDIM